MRSWITPLIFGWILSLAVAIATITTVNFSAHLADRGFTTAIADGRATVTEVVSGSAAERAGIKVGDVLDRETARRTESEFLQIDDPLRFDISREGRSLRVTFVPDRSDKSFEQRLDEIHAAFTLVVVLFTSLFITLSKVRFTSSKWLVASLLVFPLTGMLQTNHPDLSQFALFAFTPATCATLALLLQFWISFAAEIRSPLAKGWVHTLRIAWIITVTSSVTASIAAAKETLLADKYASFFELVGNSAWLDTINAYQWWGYSIVLPILCVVAPIKIIRRSTGDVENHAYWVAATLLGFAIPWSIGQPAFFILDQLGLITTYGATLNQVMGYLIWLIPLSLLLFCYVGVSQRMLSFNFAVNKTVVYLLTGGLLLLAYLLLKRNIETILPSDAETKKSAVNGLIACLVFMAKQLRDLSDIALKKFIFVDLNRRENKLSEFRNKMSHFKTSTALEDATASTLSSFCHGARVQIFSHSNGSYCDRRTQEQILVDDEIPVALRTGRSSVLNPGDPQASRWRVVTPIFDRQDLVGFIGIEYDPMLPTLRPDEIRWIEKIVRQFGIQSALLELDLLRATQRRLASAEGS